MVEMRKISSTLGLSVLIYFSISCSNLLYYPDHVLYIEEEYMQFKPEDCVLTIEGGAKVHGWYFTSQKKPKGVLIFFHGNGQNRSSHIVEVYWLLKEGYDIFAIEYPGYGDTDGKPTPQNTVAAGHAALRYVKHRQPNTPLIVYGQSLGGAVALRSVYDLQDEIKVSKIILNGSFLSYKKVAEKALEKSWVTWLFQKIPYVLLSDEYAPQKVIAKLKSIPVIVIHDKKDPVVPFELGEEIYSQMKDPKEIWALENGRHTQPFDGESGVTVRKKLLAALARLK